MHKQKVDLQKEYSSTDDLLKHLFVWDGVPESNDRSNNERKPASVEGTHTINERINRPTPKRKLSYK